MAFPALEMKFRNHCETLYWFLIVWLKAGSGPKVVFSSCKHWNETYSKWVLIFPSLWFLYQKYPPKQLFVERGTLGSVSLLGCHFWHDTVVRGSLTPLSCVILSRWIGSPIVVWRLQRNTFCQLPSVEVGFKIVSFGLKDAFTFNFRETPSRRSKVWKKNCDRPHRRHASLSFTENLLLSVTILYP